MGAAKTAQQFIRVLTSDEAALARSRDEVDRLNTVGDFDGQLEEKWNSNIKPIVHAEIQLHHWLENNGGTAPHRFFNMYTYIGSSKPTCKLCAYYFDEHPTDVKVRTSHGNVYSAWAYPPVYMDQGERGQKTRLRVMHSMKKRIVADIFRLLTERVGHRRAHDSTDQWQESVRLPPRVNTDIMSDYLDFMSDTMDNLSLAGEPDIDTTHSTPRRQERGSNNTDTPSQTRLSIPQETVGPPPLSEADTIARYLEFISDTMDNLSLSGEPAVETDDVAGSWDRRGSDTDTPSTSQLPASQLASSTSADGEDILATETEAESDSGRRNGIPLSLAGLRSTSFSTRGS